MVNSVPIYITKNYNVLEVQYLNFCATLRDSTSISTTNSLTRNFILPPLELIPVVFAAMDTKIESEVVMLAPMKIVQFLFMSILDSMK